MRLQLLIILALLFTSTTFAVDEKSIQELFQKYYQIMDQKKIELIDEVFTEKFIKSSGGKKEFIQKVSELKAPPSPTKIKMTWRKGLKGKIYFAKVKVLNPKKGKHHDTETEFIVIEENGKPKIDGTLSDAN